MKNNHKLKKTITKKKKTAKKSIRGAINAGNLLTVSVFALLFFLGFNLVNGFPKNSDTSNQTPVIVVTPSDNGQNNNLQLKTFGYITIVPTPPVQATLCQNGYINEEPQMFVYPTQDMQTLTYSSGDQIKIWVTDEAPPLIAPGEQVDTTTGDITKPGDRTAQADDGYLWEPALYIAPKTAEAGGTPYFPTQIKGQFWNDPTSGGWGNDQSISGATMDTIPTTSGYMDEYTAEDVWDVNSLGLAAGTYQAEFLVHDGDTNRGVGCFTIKIQ